MTKDSIQPVHDFWARRNVFLTGHTGFKGAWLSLWLRRMGAQVTGYALAPPAEPNLFMLTQGDTRSIVGDIRDRTHLRTALLDADPQVVIHLAAQALVRESYRDPVGTYATNVMGTGHVLDVCRELAHLQSVVIVTSDKVYENDGAGDPFSERDRLGGHDPYSNSKACAELLTASFRDSFFEHGPPIATARAGNVIGGGDWSQDRLVPDCVRALASGLAVHLRYPDSIRPWQHVLDPLSGYLRLAQALVEHPERTPRAVNFGPEPSSFRSVREIVTGFNARFEGKPGWQRDAGTHPAEATALTLSSALAREALDWTPKLGIEESLAWTADWYRAQMCGEGMAAFSEHQIERYQQL